MKRTDCTHGQTKKTITGCLRESGREVASTLDSLRLDWNRADHERVGHDVATSFAAIAIFDAPALTCRRLHILGLEWIIDGVVRLLEVRLCHRVEVRGHDP